MPDANGRFLGITVPELPWHSNPCHACLSIPEGSGIECPRCGTVHDEES